MQFLFRRALRAVALIVAVASAAMLLVHLAPGDAFSSFSTDPAVAAAERARLGLDRPFVEQYLAWVDRALRLDFGESSRFQLPVATLLGERIGNTLQLGSAALLIAIGLGLPLGVLTGSAPTRPGSRTVRAFSLLLVATPPLVTALLMLLIAGRTGSLLAAALALGLPIAASLERLQAHAIREALHEPCVAAARARGVSHQRATWTHAFRLSLRPVLGVLGILIGTILSGSFAVEIVMSWPGLGDLMYQALMARDVYLAAGCAAAGAVFLAAGVMAADIALVVADPRVAELG